MNLIKTLDDERLEGIEFRCNVDTETKAREDRAILFNSLRAALSPSSPCPHEAEVARLKEAVEGLMKWQWEDLPNNEEECLRKLKELVPIIHAIRRAGMEGG